jgi:hypothetical protein
LVNRQIAFAGACARMNRTPASQIEDGDHSHRGYS